MKKRQISKQSKRRLVILGPLSLLAIMYFLITSIGYIYSYTSLKKEEKNLQNELLSLQEEKANLKIEIQKLNNPEYVARYAKQTYLYSSNGEYVLKIDSNDKQQELKQNKNNRTGIIAIVSVCVFIIIIVILRKRKTKK